MSVTQQPSSPSSSHMSLCLLPPATQQQRGDVLMKMPCCPPGSPAVQCAAALTPHVRFCPHSQYPPYLHTLSHLPGQIAPTPSCHLWGRRVASYPCRCALLMGRRPAALQGVLRHVPSVVWVGLARFRGLCAFRGVCVDSAVRRATFRPVPPSQARCAHHHKGRDAR